MRRVWRFPLVPHDQYDHESPDDDSEVQEQRRGVGYEVEVDIPKGAEMINRVKMTSRGLACYAIVDPESELETRTFFVCANGVDLPDTVGSVTFLDTYKRTGSVTLHVFEVAKVLA